MPKGSRKHHHHHSDSRRPSRKKWLIIIAAILAYAVVFGCVVVLPKMLDKETEKEDRAGTGAELFRNSITTAYNGKDYVYRESDITNVLLIGVDTDQLSTTVSATSRSNTQADFLVLLVIDRKNATVTPLQLDRDTMTPVHVYGVLGKDTGTRIMQLCLAQGFGKSVGQNCRNTVTAVSDMLLGLPVQHYIVYDMNTINVFNDLLGGVTVQIEDDLSDVSPQMVPGATVTLHGDMAEGYVRARMGVGDGMNRSRMRRQREYLNNAITLAKELLRLDENFTSNLLMNMGDNYQSDMNMAYIVNLINRCSQYTTADFVTFEGEHRIGEDGFMEFHMNEKDMADTVLKLCYLAD